MMIKVMPIKLSEIVELENSRVIYNENDLNELMVSMKQTGLLQPIGLRPMEDGNYEIIFGNRRLRVAQKLGWKTIDSFVMSAGDTEETLILNLIENIHHSPVPLIQEGRVFKMLMKRDGLTVAQLATRVGIGKQRIQSSIHLFTRMPKHLHENIVNMPSGTRDKKGKIPARTAFITLGIANKSKLTPSQRKKLFNYAASNESTGDHLRCLAGLIRNGMAFDRAIETAHKTRALTMTFMISKRKALLAETETGKDVRQIIFDAVSKNTELGVVTYQGRVKGSKQRGAMPESEE